MKNGENCDKGMRGAIMLESLIVFTITIFLLFFILAAFSTMFQRFNIQIIANETAARLAQTYEYALKAETLTGNVSIDDAVSVDPYRYFNEESLINATDRKAKEYGEARLKKTTFTKNVEEPRVSANVIPDSLGRRHIELKIEGSYRVPFGEMLGHLGFSDISNYSVVAYADCIDLSNYINTVGFVDNWTSGRQLNSDFIKMINSAIKLVDNILDLF